MRKSITLLLLMLGFGIGTGVKGQLMITEIMYDSPMDTTSVSDSLEFMEFYNYSDQPINLNGWTLSGGVIHNFAAQVLNPGEFFIVARIAGGFGDSFGLPADQLGAGNLSNTGELIELRDPLNNIVDSVRYSSTAPWPTSAANGGYSLTLCDYESDNGVASSWTASNTAFPGLVVRGWAQIYANPGACCSYPDVTPPTITSATVVDATTIAVAFSEPVSLPSTWLANFTGGQTITSAARTVTQDSIILTLATPLVNGDFVTFQVGNVEDLFCNEMVPDSFTVVRNTGTPSLNISEILYNDPSTNDDLEFIEIFNIDTVTFPLGGFVLSGVVDGVFPEYNMPGQTKVVFAKNSATILQAFGPFGTVFQWDSGTLPNDNGLLEIHNTEGVVLESITYDTLTTAPGFWPAGASGTGHSITLCDESIQNTSGSNWQLSTSGDFTNVYQGDSIFATPGNSNCRIVGIVDALLGTTKVYPNPFTSVFTVETEATGIVGVSVVDAMGRLVKQTALDGGYARIDLSDSPRGVYFVNLRDEDGRTLLVKKLIRL